MIIRLSNFFIYSYFEYTFSECDLIYFEVRDFQIVCVFFFISLADVDWIYWLWNKSGQLF